MDPSRPPVSIALHYECVAPNGSRFVTASHAEASFWYAMNYAVRILLPRTG